MSLYSFLLFQTRSLSPLPSSHSLILSLCYFVALLHSFFSLSSSLDLSLLLPFSQSLVPSLSPSLPLSLSLSLLSLSLSLSLAQSLSLPLSLSLSLCLIVYLSLSLFLSHSLCLLPIYLSPSLTVSLSLSLLLSSCLSLPPSLPPPPSLSHLFEWSMCLRLEPPGCRFFESSHEKHTTEETSDTLHSFVGLILGRLVHKDCEYAVSLSLGGSLAHHGVREEMHSMFLHFALVSI